MNDIENCWKIHKKLAQKDGLKTIYWCINVKCRGERYLADRFPGDNEIHLYRRNQAHTCDTAVNKVVRMSEEMKKSIEKYIGLKLTPKPMLQQLRKELPNDPALKKTDFGVLQKVSERAVW